MLELSIEGLSKSSYDQYFGNMKFVLVIACLIVIFKCTWHEYIIHVIPISKLQNSLFNVNYV